MTIRRAGKGIIKAAPKGRTYTYRVGFVNLNGEADETELSAANMRDAEELWSSLCEEFECMKGSVTYVERVANA